MVNYIFAICVQCGGATIWEDELGEKPLCVACWDAEAETESERLYEELVRGREYYLAHREENRVGCRKYRRTHREELNDYHCRYCGSRRELIALRQRDYYWSHHEASLDRVRAYRKARKRELEKVAGDI